MIRRSKIVEVRLITLDRSRLDSVDFSGVSGQDGDGVFADPAEVAVHPILLVPVLDPELVPVLRDHVIAGTAQICRKKGDGSINFSKIKREKKCSVGNANYRELPARQEKRICISLRRRHHKKQSTNMIAWKDTYVQR